MVKIHNALQIKAGAKIDRTRMGVLTQPIQFLLTKDKDDDWREWNMDWLERKGLEQIT